MPWFYHSMSQKRYFNDYLWFGLSFRPPFRSLHISNVTRSRDLRPRHVMKYSMSWSVTLSQGFPCGGKTRQAFHFQSTNTCCVSSKRNAAVPSLSSAQFHGEFQSSVMEDRAWDTSSPSSQVGGNFDHVALREHKQSCGICCVLDWSAVPGLRLIWRYSKNTEVTYPLYLYRDWTESSVAGHI